MAVHVTKGFIIQMEKDKPKKKCRKWQLRVSLGKDPRTGKYRTKSRRFEGTYSEAKAALAKFIEEIERGDVQPKTSYTFSEYSSRYLTLRRMRHEVAETTLQRQGFQFHVASFHIGGMKLESIKPETLENMYMAMMRGETLSGRPSGGSYVNQVHENIRLVFQSAVEEGVLASNPCDKARPPKMDTKPKKAIDPAKAHEFIEELDPSEPRDCAYLLAITMGLRCGEVCGLSWGDINWDMHIADISHSYDSLGNLKEPKTKAGVRLLPLPSVTYDALKTMKAAQASQFEKTNRYRKPEEGYLVQDESTPVIAGNYGERILSRTLSRWWTEDRMAFGLEDFTLHELRHTYLSLLAEKGVHPKIMQELAGHSNARITMEIYTHVNMDAKREAVASVSEIF
ncbi:MAG: Site-specific integrase [Atopobium sp.]|jgi:integrase